MKNHWFRTIAGVITIIVLSVAAYAADTNNSRFTSRVKVTVSSNDNIQDIVKSYLNRELRSLNDVELVDTDPDWEIEVLAMELKTSSGNKPGVVLSTVLSLYYDKQVVINLIKPMYIDTLPPNGLQVTHYHWLNVDSKDNLQNMCNKMIAEFDSQYLEEGRKSFRKMKESLQKSK